MFQDLLTIAKKIQSYNNIIIHRHQRPDPDAIGSQVGLASILRHNFPDKTIKVVGSLPDNLSWLSKMDTVRDEDYKKALVIITDTANQERIDGEAYQLGDFLIKIDHHPAEDNYGHINYVDTNASSCSEIIVDFALANEWQLTQEAARLLYAGIVGDTGRFLYPATSAKTFQTVAFLRTFDFDFSELSRQMDTFSLTIAKLQSYVFEHLIIDDNGVACVTLTQDLLKSFNISESDTAAIVSAPGKIDTVQTWAIFVEQPEGHYRVRLRSKSVPINQVAKAHDGGGHPLASGANSFSLEENQTIYRQLQELFS